MLPDIFAIYRADSKSFQLLTTERDDDGNITRLRNWSRSKEDSGEWNRGTMWCATKTNKALSDVEPKLYKEIIHKQEYTFWFLNHMLLWTTYDIYADRYGKTLSAWMECPMVPVLEFGTKQIYPRTECNVMSLWAETSPDEVEEMSDRGRTAYRTSLAESVATWDDHVDPRFLRIRTPTPRAEEFELTPKPYRRRGFSEMSESLDSQIEALCAPKGLPQTLAIASVAFLFGLWSFSVYTMAVGA